MRPSMSFPRRWGRLLRDRLSLVPVRKAPQSVPRPTGGDDDNRRAERRSLLPAHTSNGGTPLHPEGSSAGGLGTVDALWRYPVKSMLGEALEAAEVTERGLLGDRQFALV